MSNNATSLGFADFYGVPWRPVLTFRVTSVQRDNYQDREDDDSYVFLHKAPGREMLEDRTS